MSNLRRKRQKRRLSVDYQNEPPKTSKFLVFQGPRPQWEKMPNRKIILNKNDPEVIDNKIKTNRYTAINFLPNNLYDQFKKAPYFYYLIIALLQIPIEISNTNGKPLALLPLCILLAISMTKDLVEDLRAFKSDKIENESKVDVLENGTFSNHDWQDLLIGDIVKVKEGEYFPADMVLLSSSAKSRTCYIETKNIDGETNLKHKECCLDLGSRYDSISKIQASRDTIEYEKPNPYLYKFSGTLSAFDDNGKVECKISLDTKNFLLRGCSLRNTEWIIGVLVYTGHDSKILLNSSSLRIKHSSIEKLLNVQIIWLLIANIILCLLLGLTYAAWNEIKRDQFNSYVVFTNSFLTSFFGNFIIFTGVWLLLNANICPISLVATIEVVKFLQAKVLMKDENLRSKDGTYVTVQTSGLNEEMGQVSHIFSDKTGTLTANQMSFKCLTIDGVSFGDLDPLKCNRDDLLTDLTDKPKVTNVDFNDAKFFRELSIRNSELGKKIREFLLFLACCHSVVVDSRDGETKFSASSPDELALINFAKFAGISFEGKTENNELILIDQGQRLIFRLLRVIEFTSSRRKMSVIVESNTNEIFVFTKGADTSIEEVMRKQDPQKKEITWENLESYANKGLRTLCLAQKRITKSEFESWNAKYTEICTRNFEGHEIEKEAIEAEIEKNLELIGATAIEDKLQSQVPETIALLKEAGIKLWVLTGDKVATAINVGFSSNLLTKDMEILVMDDGDLVENKEFSSLNEETMYYSQKVQGILEKNLKLIQENSDREFGFIISGRVLSYTLLTNESPALVSLFIAITDLCKAVIASRLFPKQKQQIVELIRMKKPKIVTLAVGDGANDVNMIVAAHIGVGIHGKEGQQAARASDISIGEFSVLKRLLLYSGRENYRRIIILILYNFYKNFVAVIPYFWVGFFSVFSGWIMYDPLTFQFLHILYTLFPIFIVCVGDEEFPVTNSLGNFVKGPPTVFEKNPQLYSLGLNYTYDNKMYIRWLGLGCIHSLAIIIVSEYTISYGFITSEGHCAGWDHFGTLVFTSVVSLINIKTMMMANTWGRMLDIIMFLCQASYFMMVAIISKMAEQEQANTINLMGKGNFWLGLFLIIIVTLGIDLFYDRFIYFNKAGVRKNIKRRVQDKSSNSVSDQLIDKIRDSQGKRRLSNLQHGFGFSEEEPVDKFRRDSVY